MADSPCGERCENCRFWNDSADRDLDGNLDVKPIPGPDGKLWMPYGKPVIIWSGYCQRYPPTLNRFHADPEDEELDVSDDVKKFADAFPYTNARFPLTTHTDWCGEWQPARDDQHKDLS